MSRAAEALQEYSFTIQNDRASYGCVCWCSLVGVRILATVLSPFLPEQRVSPYIQVPQRLWERDASGQPVLKCSSLKSFSLTRDSLPEQLEFLCTNEGLVSLEWWSVSNASAPFTGAVKDLRLHYGFVTPEKLVSRLSNFTNLERLHVESPYK